MALPIKSSDLSEPTRLFREITEKTEPLHPLPEDTYTDIVYTQLYEQRCSLCNAPAGIRTLAEHVYLDSGKKIMPVIHFFNYYYSAKLNYTQVATHMEQHCSFRGVSISGLKSYEAREEEVSQWKYREHDLVLTALLVELDDIRGIDCGKSNDLKIKRAQMVERLTSRILDVKSKRDEGALNSLNVFEILGELHDKVIDPNAKQIIRNTVKEIRQKISPLSNSN
jgi:hypothetical protein